MSRNLTELYGQKDIYELIEIASSNSGDYTEEAIETATAELEKRGMPLESTQGQSLHDDVVGRLAQEKKIFHKKGISKFTKTLIVLMPFLAWWFKIFSWSDISIQKKIDYIEAEMLGLRIITCFMLFAAGSMIFSSHPGMTVAIQGIIHFFFWLSPFYYAFFYLPKVKKRLKDQLEKLT